MKHKLKDVVFSDIHYSIGTLSDNGKLINVQYKNESLEFQTPRVLIEEIIDEKYLKLKMFENKACQSFLTGVKELEKNHSAYLKNKINSIFDNYTFTVKIPFRYSKPDITIFNNGALFNYYHLVPGMEIICLVGCNTLWTNKYGVSNYNLLAKEILLKN